MAKKKASKKSVEQVRVVLVVDTEDDDALNTVATALEDALSELDEVEVTLTLAATLASAEDVEDEEEEDEEEPEEEEEDDEEDEDEEDEDEDEDEDEEDEEDWYTEAELKAMTKADLLELAEEYEIDVDKPTKAKLVKALLD